MARNYIGDEQGIARKLRHLFIGDEQGIARAVKKTYIGDENGVAQLCFIGGVTWAKNYADLHGSYVERAEEDVPSAVRTSRTSGGFCRSYEFSAQDGYARVDDVPLRNSDGTVIAASDLVGLYYGPFSIGNGTSWQDTASAMVQVTNVLSVVDKGNYVQVEYEYRYVAYADRNITHFSNAHWGPDTYITAPEGSLPEEGTLIAETKTYIVLRIDGVYFYYERQDV